LVIHTCWCVGHSLDIEGTGREDADEAFLGDDLAAIAPVGGGGELDVGESDRPVEQEGFRLGNEGGVEENGVSC
jgi:hypothetical protein